MTWDSHIQETIKNCKYFIYLGSPNSNPNKRYLIWKKNLAIRWGILFYMSL